MAMTIAGLQLADPAGSNSAGLVTLVVALVSMALGPLTGGAAVVFWLWRARANIEALSAERPRLGQGWVIGSWVVPLGNLALPLIVMLDVVRGSRRPAPGWVVAWWVCWIGGWGAIWGAWASSANQRFGSPGYDEYTGFIVFSVFGMLLMAGAAATLNVIINEVNRAQEQQLGTARPGGGR